MKFFNLKNKIGMNLIALCGWTTLYFVFIWPLFLSEGAYFALIFVLMLIEAAIFICCIITFIEIGLAYRIQNKFILENKIYNVFWLIGMFVSILLTLTFFVIFCRYVFS